MSSTKSRCLDVSQMLLDCQQKHYPHSLRDTKRRIVCAIKTSGGDPVLIKAQTQLKTW